MIGDRCMDLTCQVQISYFCQLQNSGVIWYFEPHGKLNPGSKDMQGSQNIMCRGVHIQWVGGQNTMDRGVDIPWVRGSIYHG